MTLDLYDRRPWKERQVTKERRWKPNCFIIYDLHLVARYKPQKIRSITSTGSDPDDQTHRHRGPLRFGVDVQVRDDPACTPSFLVVFTGTGGYGVPS